MKKLKVCTFVLSALMLQSICVNAASSKKSDEYTREEIENRRPGFYASDIAKSVQYVNSGKNTFSAKEAPSIDDEDDYEQIENYTYNQVGPISASDIVTINAIPGSSAKWGRANNGNWIYLENNQPGTGWKLVNGEWYYMDSNGVMQTGWVNYKGNWYYLYSSGQMATNTWVEGYYVNSSGIMV